MIVSCSWDKTIRRWNADTGVAICSSIRGHYESVLSVPISSDGELIVSGSEDYTVRRWRACTGEAIGEPLRRGNSYIEFLTKSEDDK